MAGNYVLLERIELNATAASVTFSSIPQTGYTDLKLVMSMRDNRGAYDAVAGITKINGTTMSGGSLKNLGGNGSAAFSESYSNIWAGIGSTSTDTTNTFGNAEVYIPNYSVSGVAKTFSQDGVSENNGTTAFASMSASLWTGTAAISSFEISPLYGSLFLTGSSFSLYGLAAVGTTPAIAPKADGGNVIATDGTYWYHAFLSNGTFTPQINLSCDYLVVAGGGGGGPQVGGGGGAGGLRLTTSQSLSATNYAVTIGAGGASAGAYSIPGYSGTNSSFNSYSVTGGGGGGYHAANAGPGLSGGSGGGGGAGTSTGGSGGSGNAGSYSPVEGYAGGNGTGGGTFGAGGGGGASAVGAAGSGSTGGAGGAGANSYNGTTFTSWLSTTSLGASGYLAGGGGGCSNSGGVGGSGGIGGGGNGSGPSSAGGTSGTANTGGGGGGYRDGYGGNGGSGIIIIRYPVA